MAVALIILAGCGGSTPLIGVNAASIPAAAKDAWAGDLLYVATGGDVYVLSYPSGKVVGRLGVQYAVSLCSDKRGNVFVVQGYGVTEYSHRGKLVRTLQSSDVATSCSLDPTTGNLAVPYVGSGGQYVVIYPGARGPGQTVYGIPFPVPGLCGYDIHGNLFVDGSLSVLSELPKGGTSFANYDLGPKIDLYDSINWDGTYVTLSNPGTHSIYRVKISHRVKIVGATRVHGWVGGFSFQSGGTQTWLKDGQFIAQWHNGGQLAIWSYPAGGAPTRVLPPFVSGNYSVDGVVLSLGLH
ncbi:MAG TPA: hypothetical protein VHR97_11020 [Candidatus Baltobacteraceae bacterium]|nr:hypothetical protein [Candidatus Baltobacteraceae bacterium]